MDILEFLKAPLSENAEVHKDSQCFTQQVETLREQKVDTPTIIGAVGNTGTGKSSVINALLDEERLVPTNWFVGSFPCFRTHAKFYKHARLHSCCD